MRGSWRWIRFGCALAALALRVIQAERECFFPERIEEAKLRQGLFGKPLPLLFEQIKHIVGREFTFHEPDSKISELGRAQRKLVGRCIGVFTDISTVYLFVLPLDPQRFDLFIIGSIAPTPRYDVDGHA